MVIEYLAELSGKRNVEDTIDTSKVKRTPRERAAFFIFRPIIFNYHGTSAHKTLALIKLKLRYKLR
jgi:hypothetical protein